MKKPILFLLFCSSGTACGRGPWGKSWGAALEKAVPREAEEIYAASRRSIALSATGCRIWRAGAPERPAGAAAGPAQRCGPAAILILCGALETFPAMRRGSSPVLGGALGISAVAAGDLGPLSVWGADHPDAGGLRQSAAALPDCRCGRRRGRRCRRGTYAATVFFMDLLLAAGTWVVMPLIYMYIAAVTVRAALGTPR